ncbi:hypothetical protein GCM10027053_25480 [Intrasporangium mesophilum]
MTFSAALLLPEFHLTQTWDHVACRDPDAIAAADACAMIPGTADHYHWQPDDLLLQRISPAPASDPGVCSPRRAIGVSTE